MNYQETLDWLFNQLPMYQNQGAKAYKTDLSNTLLLMDYLGNPEKSLKCIHVAGTNGKGSTCHMLASVLQEQGYKTGLYTSPHLLDFRERIKINGEKISKEFIVDFFKTHKVFFEKNHLSFFEMTVGLSFQYFKDCQIDYVVLETGLGGRLDSTNVVDSLVAVITNIGLDHTMFLGDTLPKIAKEKAGIIKRDTPVVVGEYQMETLEVFSEVSKKMNAKLYKAFDLKEVYFECDLKGVYQLKNIKTAYKAIQVLRSLKVDILEESVENGLKKVIGNTGLLGRYQVLSKNPKIICDTAHNKEGLSLVLNQLLKESYCKLHIVLGVVSDKDLVSILSLLPKEAVYYFTKPTIARGFSEVKLKKLAEDFNLIGNNFNNVDVAFKNALNKADKKDLIFIGGSTFVVADYLKIS